MQFDLHAARDNKINIIKKLLPLLNVSSMAAWVAGQPEQFSEEFTFEPKNWALHHFPINKASISQGGIWYWQGKLQQEGEVNNVGVLLSWMWGASLLANNFEKILATLFQGGKINHARRWKNLELAVTAYSRLGREAPNWACRRICQF
ncbi:hypothetical protein ACJX0J_011252, partial [Zea mays]